MKWWLNKIQDLSDFLCRKGYPFNWIASEIKALMKYPQQKKELPTIDFLQNTMLTGPLIQELWLNHSHRELKEVFQLGSSPVLSKQITVLKELALKKNNPHSLVASTLLIMSFKGKSSEVISQYLEVVLRDLTSEAPRASVHMIVPGQVEEIQLALVQITDEQLRLRCPSSYEILTTTLYNSLSDIGRLLMRSPNGIVYPAFKSFHDLSQKISRRWHFLYAPFVKYPTNDVVASQEGKIFQDYEIKLIKNSAQLYACSVDLENCLYTYSELLRRKEKNFLVLAKEGKTKYVCEVDMHMKITEFKGPYNTDALPSLKQDFQYFLYKEGKK